MTIPIDEPGVLATARYGKVPVFRVVRDPESKVHDVVGYNVTVLVEGAIETRCIHIPILPAPPKSSHTENILGAECLSGYTEGNNSGVVATDSSVSLHTTTPPVFKFAPLINTRQQSEEHC